VFTSITTLDQPSAFKPLFNSTPLSLSSTQHLCCLEFSYEIELTCSDSSTRPVSSPHNDNSAAESSYAPPQLSPSPQIPASPPAPPSTTSLSPVPFFPALSVVCYPSLQLQFAPSHKPSSVFFPSGIVLHFDFSLLGARRLYAHSSVAERSAGAKDVKLTAICTRNFG
jgi:hypothetical protein